MKTHLAAAAALCLSTAVAGAATTQRTHRASAARPLSASMVLNKLHAIDQQQIEGGNLAIGQAWSPQARELASRMVEDYTAAEAKVSAVAKKLNVTLTDAMDARLPEADLRDLHDDLIQLRGLSQFEGLDFDRSYLRLMAATERKATRGLEQAAASAAEPAVRDLATELLPAVQEHRALAETALQAITTPK